MRLQQIIVGMLVVLVMLFGALNLAPVFSQNAKPVEKRGLQVRVILEQVNSVQSSELNGKYKIRLGESTFEPGGYLGKHHHSGPGIRYVTFGEITSVSAGRSKVYQAGESFYESGNDMHELYNKTDAIAGVLNFEILPSDWKGTSAVSVEK